MRVRATLPIRGEIRRRRRAASGRTARFRASGYTRLSRPKIRPAHSLGLAAAAAFAILITGFGVVTVVQSAHLVRERDKAEKVSELIVDLFRGYDPSETRGQTVTAREILDEGVRRIEVELSDQPEIQSAVMDAIGRVYQNLGLYDSAAPLLERALEMRRSGDQVVVAQSLDHLGLLLSDRGEYEGAEALFREALAMNLAARSLICAKRSRCFESFSATSIRSSRPT